jgi:hypothetical protein
MPTDAGTPVSPRFDSVMALLEGRSTEVETAAEKLDLSREVYREAEAVVVHADNLLLRVSHMLGDDFDELNGRQARASGNMHIRHIFFIHGNWGSSQQGHVCVANT